MGENSKIAWTDHTFNPWVGCTKVSPGCDHCYAESWAKRSGLVKWGPGKARHRTSHENWMKPFKWDKAAAAAGVRARVFCSSLADVFDNEVAHVWREDLFTLIWSTPHLDWLLLTKRIGNAMEMLPQDWRYRYPNVWLGATVVNQAEADRDIVKMLAVPARLHFLSMEPLLEMVDISEHLWGKNPICSNCPQDMDCECGAYTRKENGQPSIDWVICGGESGSHARPMDLQWAVDIRQQCEYAKVPFFMKQLSGLHPEHRLEEFPENLRVREWPEPQISQHEG